ncbi:conserved Plasmodium protein, unknown function [Plasmodium knowlesi strain H]|uniref:AP-5 complex subunit sigma-1 n=3 Tax=Plasmodium knowlesi TaxID=5850 RepID=A0A5K1V985_PLAKH|nr:AP-5 complex subunit sigma-1, putative [Plasmodium knowlesi strain H]OTN66061.1 Uncharacterized protein PKNOH_S100035100 [Plasmodium knowlesi]CAA9987716.1 AP-5 complex subunit sigma-1, putative [Plasmodium knowlesi strain H]SBO26939.1 conserved Plasmodium protein, unknown function [Plasmodium knowlesi strain H]SBO29606.1 conserved Plasmodium protein, unknown function [Plasmodium knowlesi strain H]VVS77190.1 AP-5 complex subunit sigma-1, putative [Plasmodium knowlesi strain H]|eukprot:XP_002258714.1 hypothetical protein, conserved in Plasmodium species [Plasmodium knowlesi strain H]
MVYGIIIHSSERHEKYYFSYYYDAEKSKVDVEEEENDCIRQQTIIKRVLEEITYYENEKMKTDNTAKKHREKYFDLLDAFLSKNNNDEGKINGEGFFRIINPSLFKNRINVLWKVVNKICYTLVFYAHENIHLADYFLHTFINALREQHDSVKRKKCKSNMELFHPDTVLAVLYFFLPKGQLLLMNENHANFLNSQVKQFLADKAQISPKDSKLV